MVPACLIRPNAVLFKQDYHDCISPIQGRHKIGCRGLHPHRNCILNSVQGMLMRMPEWKMHMHCLSKKYIQVMNFDLEEKWWNWFLIWILQSKKTINNASCNIHCIKRFLWSWNFILKLLTATNVIHWTCIMRFWWFDNSKIQLSHRYGRLQ